MTGAEAQTAARGTDLAAAPPSPPTAALAWIIS